jgi:hypothetical protein
MATMQELKKKVDDIVDAKVETVESIEEEGIELDIMTLDQHPGWKAVKKELEKERDGLESEIFDINNGLSSEVIKELRIRRYYLDYLINLPKHKSELFRQRKDSKEENILVEDI